MSSKLELINKNIEYMGKYYIDIGDFETCIDPDDEDQTYLLSLTTSGTFKTSKGVEYRYVDECNTFVMRNDK